MLISNLQINHVPAPMGFDLGETPVVSYMVTDAMGSCQTSVRLRVYRDDDYGLALYDSGRLTESQPVYPLMLALTPRTCYRVLVEVESDAGESAQKECCFETGKMEEPWTAQWIGPDKENLAVPEVGHTFHVASQVRRARLYVACAGLYRVELNGKKAGEEYLTPYFTDYVRRMQIITHDLTESLWVGENSLCFTLAGGWYMGSFSLFRGGGLYGDQLAVLAELHITYADGHSEVIASSGAWTVRDSIYDSAEIYDGVVMDYRKALSDARPATIQALPYDKLCDRLSPPVHVMETMPVQRVFTTPKGELCLDIGQNMAGLLAVDTSTFAERDFILTFFETLDTDGNVYTANLRTAKQQLLYKSDGRARVIEPEFTYYGFRYVHIEGLTNVSSEAFIGKVLHSNMAQTGTIETSNPLVNRLFLNALWGQKSNFIDLPTDCPQRDERLGWTCDVQLFCGTALYNMDAAAFFTKFMADMRSEQQYCSGAVPLIVPSCVPVNAPNDGAAIMKSGVAAWGDAATVIPWNHYLHTGDLYALRAQYPLMRDWVEYIRQKDNGNRLWDSGFQLGDWLALDTPPSSKCGLTPETLVASAYYLYSAELTAKAAHALGFTLDEAMYTKLADEVRAAIRHEFVTASGRVGSDTQTADVLALYMGFATDPAKTADSLEKKSRGRQLVT